MQLAWDNSGHKQPLKNTWCLWASGVTMWSSGVPPLLLPVTPDTAKHLTWVRYLSLGLGRPRPWGFWGRRLLSVNSLSPPQFPQKPVEGPHLQGMQPFKTSSYYITFTGTELFICRIQVRIPILNPRHGPVLWEVAGFHPRAERRPWQPSTR